MTERTTLFSFSLSAVLLKNNFLVLPSAGGAVVEACGGELAVADGPGLGIGDPVVDGLAVEVLLLAVVVRGVVVRPAAVVNLRGGGKKFVNSLVHLRKNSK